MKIKAQARLVQASSQTALLKFLSKMTAAEVDWFYNEMPRLFGKWFDSLNDAEKKSKHLPIQFASTVNAAEYTPVDAMAVAMGHLKFIYDPKIKKPLHRSLLMSKTASTPDKAVINFLSKSKWGALQSWTYLAEPIVMDRDVVPKKQFEFVLELSAAEAEKHVVTDYKQLMRISMDARALEKQLTKLFPKVVFNIWGWKRLSDTVRRFQKEEEVFLYVPTGTGLKCRWKAREYDLRYGYPLPWGYESSVPSEKAPAEKPAPVPKTTKLAPKIALEFFKTAGQPFKVGPSIYTTVGKMIGGKVMGLPLVEVRRAAEQNKLKALQPKSLDASQCTPLPGKKFKPEMVGYINKWLKLHP